MKNKTVQPRSTKEKRNNKDENIKSELGNIKRNCQQLILREKII